MRFVLIGLAVALALGSAACSGSAAAVPKSSSKAIVVSAAVLRRQQLSNDITVNAEFRPNQEVDVYAKVAGYIRQISVDVGDRVAAGQVVATLEVPELVEDLAHAQAMEEKSQMDARRARSEVARAETDYKYRELEYSRLAEVARQKPKLVAEQEVDDRRARAEQAKAQLDAMRAGLSAAEQQVQVSAAAKTRVGILVDYLKITAPFDGIVTRRYADTGAMIQAGTASQTQSKAVIRVAEDKVLRLVLPVPESAVANIRVGGPVEIRVDVLNHVVQGKVARFTGQVDQATRTMDTEVDVPNPDAQLKPGMFAHATIPIKHRENALAIPVQAITRNNGYPTAVVVSSNRVEIRRLKTGLETPYYAEVLEGAELGDVVVLGSRSLRPGQLVEAHLTKPAGRESEN
jgi:RND family efflux transporter MFP subunit